MELVWRCVPYTSKYIYKNLRRLCQRCTEHPRVLVIKSLKLMFINFVGTEMKRLASLGLSVIVASNLTGCAVAMAAKQPDYKNVDLFKPGTTRGQLLGEFGQPVSTETRKDGTKCDTFSFTQGYPLS